VRENIEKQKLKEVLDKCGRNISKAAKMLGISRPTIYNLKKKYGF
jgi:two-component system NtrC family response regulator